MTASLLFAAIPFGDIVEIVLAIVIGLGIGLYKLVNMMNQQKPPEGAGKPPKPKPQPAPRDALSNEIDEFLRRATQRKQQTQTNRPRPVAQPKPTDQPVQAEVVARPVGGGLDKHLRQFSEEKKQFEQRAARLGDEVALADDKIEAHLKEKFTHKLGTLERRSGESAASPASQPTGFAEDQISPMPVTAAAGFAAILSNAAGIRQAVVLTEILNRPTDRWE